VVTPAEYVVTANTGGNSAPGIQMVLYQALNIGTIPGSWNTAVQSGAAAHTASVTTTAAHSLVLGATVNGSAVVTPVTHSGVTADTSHVDTANDGGYLTQHYVSSASGANVTLGVSDSSAGGAVVVEIPLTSAPTPANLAANVGLGVGYTNASQFLGNTQVVIATVSALGDPTAGQVAMYLSDTFGLEWTQIASANATLNFYAGIWIGQAPGELAAPTAQTLTPAVVGSPYSVTIPGALGFPPYVYGLASGSLPAGLSLTAATGQISGTPTASGTSTFEVWVVDSLNNAAMSGTMTVVVQAEPPVTPSIVKTWQAQGTPYSYGTTTTPISNVSGNWLFAVVSWTQTDDGQAQAYVTDNAHNVYRPITYAGAYTWHQVFCVPNAKAATALYTGTSAYVRDLVITVVEVQGLTAGYVVDVSTTDSGSSTSDVNMSVTTTQADFVFWVMSSTAGFLTVSGSPSVYSTTPRTAQVIGGAYVSSPGSYDVDVSLDSLAWEKPANYSGALIAVSATAAPIISSPNRAWPKIRVQAAFGYQPGSPIGPPTWTDISDRFLELNGNRGRNFELDELSAADMTLKLDNFDGALSPGNTSSPYYPNVTLVTPIQVLADWQGRRYSLFTGVITAIPQTYDFNRGVTEVALSDDFSKLPQVLLPSAMISEVLYDRPLNLWPLNDAPGSAMASNWSGISDAVLLPTASKYGQGTPGETPSTGFGNQNGNGLYPTGLEGTTDTTWGNYSNTAPYVINGTCLVDRDDPNLPIHTTGATYEVWALLANDDGNAFSGATIMCVMDDKGTNGGGDYFKLVIFNTGMSTGTQFCNVYMLHDGYSWSGGHLFEPPYSGATLFDGSWHLYSVTISTTRQVTLYIDGYWVGSYQGSFPPSPPNRLCFGGDPTVDPLILRQLEGIGIPGYLNVSATPGYFTGYMANAAVFPRVIDPERIQAHFASGLNGFVGESSGTRIRRILTWAGWSGPQAIEYGLSHQQVFNYLGDGYGSSGLSGAIGQFSTAGGSAEVDDGAQADVTIQDIANSECGLMLVGADGTLSFRERDSQYNQAYSASLGDMDYALNGQETFASGLGPWTTNGSLATSGIWSYAGGKSALLTVTSTSGATYAGTEFVSAEPGDTVAFSAWVMSPHGCYASPAIGFYDSGVYVSGTSAAYVWCPPMTPLYLTSGLASVPGGANQVQGAVWILSGSAIGTELYFDHARISPTGFQVPYGDDVEITEDIQYLFNDIAVTRNIDQATYRTRDLASRAKYYPRVYTRTIYTAESDAQAVVDVANWLLADYSQPSMRVSQVTVDAGADPEAWPFVLGTDIGDLVSFQRTPLGGAPVEGVFMVLSIEPDIGEDKATFTYVLAPSPSPGNILTLDDPVYGLVGASNELGW
jgi:hypothetical protein